MFKMGLKLLKSDRGATAVEYGLILAMIALTSLVALQGVANETGGMWNLIKDKSQSAIDAARPS